MERHKGTEKPNNSVPIDKGNYGVWSTDFASSQGGGCWLLVVFFFPLMTGNDDKPETT